MDTSIVINPVNRLSTHRSQTADHAARHTIVVFPHHRAKQKAMAALKATEYIWLLERTAYLLEERGS